MKDYSSLREEVGITGDLSRERVRSIVNDVFVRSDERFFLEFYYGLVNEVPMNDYVELGRMFGLKSRKIRNLHKRALKTLRNHVLGK